MTPQFKGLLHLSLNNLLVSSEVLASTSPNGSIGLKQAPDFFQKENLEMLTHLDSEDKREQYKADYENLSNEIAAKIDIPFETQFTGGKLTLEIRNERIEDFERALSLVPVVNRA